MLITIIDLEWTTEDINWPWQPRDIIEVGACQLDTETGRILRKTGCVVKPTVARVSRRCTNLTGITPTLAADGVNFAAACELLHTAYDDATSWASFGDKDKIRLEDQCIREHLPFPLTSGHIDIRRVSETHLGWWRRRSLMATLGALGLEFHGRSHSALADAENAARVLRAVL